jgi:proteasome lid subunit RPN8/RPN11
VNDNVKQHVASVPDIDSVVADTWCRRSFPIQGQGSRNVVQVVVKRSVLEAICQHGLSSTDVEVCGVLVGNCYQDDRGPYIYIEAIIQGEHSDNKVAQVTFTSETWNHIQDEMDQHFSEQRILGWYHTHPGFGIFLSAMDMFIHENFFNESDQLALVYDPINGEDGLFVWHDGKAELFRYLVEEDAATIGSSAGKKDAPTKPRLTAAARVQGDDMPTRLLRLERRYGLLKWCIIATAVLAVVWPFLLVWFDLSTFIRPASSNADSSESVPVDSPSRLQTDDRKRRDSNISPGSETKSFSNGSRSDASLSEVPELRLLPGDYEETRPVIPRSRPQPTKDNGPESIEDRTPSRERNDATPGNVGEGTDILDASSQNPHE